MDTLLKKYLSKDIGIFFKPLSNGDIEITLTDISHNINEKVQIPRDIFFGYDSKTLETYLNPVFAKLGAKKAKVYGDKYKSYQQKEFEKFWKESKDIFP